YLALRRTLGYKLERVEKLLGQFLAFLEASGTERVSTEQALTWARQPASAERSNWPGRRLGVVRGFARYLQSVGVDAEVPPEDLLPWRSQRANPYLYTEQEVRALIAAARRLRSPLRVATYQTLVGLLAVTGMRVGEAIHLDRNDFDAEPGVLLVRRAKFNKTRELPLHATTAAGLARYLARRDRSALYGRSPALLVSPVGTRLRYCNVQWTFQRLVRAAGLKPRTRSCRPRIHDLRHSFAVRTLIEAYEQGIDTQQRLTVLATYLGHVNPANTYWYLSASPELLGQAAARLEQHQGGTA
ncbi:MAG: tyrosine-type recombinase/integrase, partial [Rhodanobacteraceae bacterium]